MSNKSAKKPKSPSVPREMALIQKSYQDCCLKAGQLQYQIKVYTAELELTNNELWAINNEAAARNKLNAQTPAPTAEEGSNV